MSHRLHQAFHTEYQIFTPMHKPSPLPARSVGSATSWRTRRGASAAHAPRGRPGQMPFRSRTSSQTPRTGPHTATISRGGSARCGCSSSMECTSGPGPPQRMTTGYDIVITSAARETQALREVSGHDEQLAETSVELLYPRRWAGLAEEDAHRDVVSGRGDPLTGGCGCHATHKVNLSCRVPHRFHLIVGELNRVPLRAVPGLARLRRCQV